jgi:DNA-binding NarL/FixJ family response regulator
MPIKVAIVEDNAGVRERWADLLGSSTACECICVCCAAEEALEKIPPLKPEVVLMDIGLPGMSGIECTARLKQQLPDTQVVIVTVYSDTQKIFQALQAGASGYLLKRTPPRDLLKAIKDVIGGSGPMTGQIARKLIELFHRPAPAQTEATTLTARETEVLELLAQGFAYKEIADRLGVSFHTVNMHLRHIYEKLHVRSRAEATAKYRSWSPGTPAPPRAD